MTFSSHLPSSPASISICSFSPAGGFSKKFPHLLRLRLNGIPQAAFLPPPLTVKEDRGPPLSLHASLSSRLCPSVLLSNPPLSLSFFLFPPAGLHFNLTPGWRGKKKKDSFAIRWLHGCTSLSVVETGSEGLTCSAVRPQLCRGDRTCLAATAEVYRKYVRAFRGKKDKYAKHQTHLNDGTSRHRVIVSSSFRMFCFRVFFCNFLQPKLHNTFVVAVLVFVVFFCQCFTPERLWREYFVLNLHHKVCVAVLMLQHLKYFMNS